MAIAFICIGLFSILIVTFADGGTKKRFAKEGKDVEATVFKVVHSGGYSKYQAKLKYSIDGVEYETSMGTNTPPVEGDKVTIRYLMDDPSQIFIKNDKTRQSITRYLVHIAGFGFIVAGIISGLVQGWFE